MVDIYLWAKAIKNNKVDISRLTGRNGDLETNASDLKPHTDWMAHLPTEQFNKNLLGFVKLDLTASTKRLFKQA